MESKKGFTLVELLAVIAVLALIVIIAVPKINKTMENSKKRTMVLTAKSIAKSAEARYHENKTYGVKEEITCESVTSISKSEYKSCKITFDSEGNANVTIKGIGSYKGLNICGGTKENANAIKEACDVLLTVNLNGGTTSVTNSGNHKEGSKVTLTIPTKEGYLFDKWVIISGTNASIDENTLTMGTDTTEIKATWIKLISFTMDTTIYEAEEGMTLKEWVESEYNVDNFIIESNVLYNSTKKRKNTSKNPDDEIIEDEEISLVVAHSGGSAS